MSLNFFWSLEIFLSFLLFDFSSFQNVIVVQPCWQVLYAGEQLIFIAFLNYIKLALSHAVSSCVLQSSLLGRVVTLKPSYC